MATLYLVATPIGNLEDISARALRVLREVRLIAAEDTRVTRKLLAHFDIHTPLTSYHEHNKRSQQATILAALAEGDVALVSDAGTPTLNDPGYELVCAALAAGHRVSPVPGPCAPIAALTVSGLPTDAFLYLGYLPRQSAERRAALQRIADLPYTLIFLEAPHRLLATLTDLQEVLGDRPVAIARELTKVYEQVWRGSLSEALVYFHEHAPRGEFTLVIAGHTLENDQPWSEDAVREAIRAGLRAGEGLPQLAARLARASGWERRRVYHLALQEGRDV